MKQVLHHLKKYTLPILACLALLCVQAYCDLSLPEYMSNIVNVGIQQGGIDSIVPERLRAEDMEALELFMTADEKETILSYYSQEEINGDQMYVLGNVKTEELTELENTFRNPMAALYLMQNYNSQTEGEASESGNLTDSVLGNETKFTIPEGMDIIDVISAMPEESRMAIRDKIDEAIEQLETLGGDTVDQMLTVYVQDLYKHAGVDTDFIRNIYLIKSGLIMILYTLFMAAANISTVFFASRVGAAFSRDLRRSVYTKVIRFSGKESSKFSTASLITRCTNDIQQIQMVIIMFIRIALYAPILGIGALVKVLSSDADMSWVILVAVLAVFLVVLMLMIFAMPKFTSLQKLIDKLNLVSREILTGLPVIRAFSRERFEENRFDKANKQLMKTNLFVNRMMAVMMPAMMFIMNGTSVLIIWVGSGYVDSGAMQVGDMMAFIQYTVQIILSFLMLSMMSIMLPRAFVSAKRVGEVLETEISIADPKAKDLHAFDETKKGVVEFNHVSFKYPGADECVLKDINFTAYPAQTTAIIGSTGSGKSTLINLIPRFYDVTEGSIKVSGADVRNVKIHDLRDKIGYVPQKGFLFSGTIASNIAYSDEEMEDSRIEKAAEIAQAKEFIDSKPHGYESVVSQGGTNVSGGQRQRLSIARAVAKDPDIYIFDDSFSALDFKTDKELRSALNKATKNSTILIVAQRISTILHADNIIVLDEGKIAGMGTHGELLKNCEVYRQIASSQLSKEELNNG